MLNHNLISYYNDRAKEYDQVYQNPLEQQDLQKAGAVFQMLFAGKSVLEIACGSGYWTECISQTAASIAATDINEQVLEIARQRPLDPHVRFSLQDMYQLPPDRRYKGLFGGFIWSHILLQDLDPLLERLQGCLAAGGTLAFIDSNPLENTFHDTRNIAQTDEWGNTYQLRKLENGSSHLVLKNFPSNDFLFQKLSKIGTEVSVERLPYYWMAWCRAR